MKKINLIALFSLALITIVSLSSWRLFGKDEPTDQTPSGATTGQCYVTGLQDTYFFGFRTKKDVHVMATADCETGEITGSWVPSGE